MAAGKLSVSSSAAEPAVAMASAQAGHACTVRGAINVAATSIIPAMKRSHFMRVL
jgi:hypothetical protein